MGVQKFKRPVLITARANQVDDADDVEIDVLQQSELGAGGVDYSTDEQDTGRKWIDGTTIVYQKTIAITQWPNNGTANLAHGIVNLGVVIHASGTFKASDGVRILFGESWTTTVTDNTIGIGFDQTNIMMKSISNWAGAGPPTEAYVTVLYTKTA